MKKARRKTYKITAVLLTVLMLLSTFSEIPLLSASAEEPVTIAGDNKPTQNVAVRQADPSTMDDYETVLALDSEDYGSRYAGRLWTDKSVFANGFADTGNRATSWKNGTLTLDSVKDGVSGSPTIDASDADFLEVLSALGSSTNSEKLPPLDVVLLLDISRSMTEGGEGINDNNDSLHKVIAQANSFIKKLMGNDPKVPVHPDNRVGVVVYGGGNQELLPLGHYTSSADDETFFKIDPKNFVSVSDKTYFAKITTSVKEKEFEGQKTTDVMVADSTYLQGALYQGMGMLAEAEGTVYHSGQSDEAVRKPVLIVLTDGATNIISATTTSNGGSTTYKWHDPYSGVIESAKDQRKGDLQYAKAGTNPFYADCNRYTGNGYESSGRNTVANRNIEIQAIAPRTVSCLLLAGYMKNKIQDHYGVDMFGFSIGYNVGGTNVGDYAVEQLLGTINPRYYFSDKHGTEVNSNELKTAEITAAKDAIESYVGGGGPTMRFPRDNTKFYIYTQGNLYANFTWDHPSDAGANDVNAFEDVYYINQYYDASKDAADIEGVFNSILEEVNTPIFSPVGGTNDLGVSDAVTFEDSIGEYMEVEDVKNLVLFGQNHEVTRTAVYDASFVEKKGSSFQMGWYKDNQFTSAQDDGNGGSYPSNQDGINSAEDAWKAGWVYYLDKNTAEQFLPSNEEIKADTKYTFYRLQETKDARDKLRLNPAYADLYSEWSSTESEIKGKLSSDSDAYLEYPGVYKLSDMRVWVESANDTNDTISAPRDTLWVNIPVNALPLRTATIGIDSTTGGDKTTYSYATNIGLSDPKEANGYQWETGEFAAQDLPVRVFYTVSIADDIKTKDGQVDLSKLQKDYLEKYKVTDKTEEKRALPIDHIEFISNYYSGIGETGEPTSNSGNTEVSFSPSEENSYYVFQDALPLYHWTGGSGETPPKEIQIEDTDSSGKLENDEITTKLGNVSLVENATDMKSEDWYYIVLQYYVPTSGGKGKKKYVAIPRQGKEFGSDVDDGITGAYLCWYDAEEESSTQGETRPYNAAEDGRGKPTDTSKGQNWVVAARKGGLRTGVLSRNAKQKSDNTTVTAINYYQPTISERTEKENIVIIADVFLGNNGRLAVIQAKTEETPGEGELVGVGDTITYSIHWAADPDADSVVTITDPLDDGVDFVSASIKDEKEKEITIEPGELIKLVVVVNNITINEKKDIPVRISYIPLTHKVTWTIGEDSEGGVKVPAGASGNVTLKVRVNEKALKTWDYDLEQNLGSSGEDEDFEVKNRAQIDVNNAPYFTNIVENPTPGKTEDNPGDGKGVSIGEEITYHVHWEGDRNEESVVTVTDPLDQGVDFVRGAFEENFSDVSITADSPSKSGTATIGTTQNIPVSISYDASLRMVTWIIGAEGEGGVKVPAGASGDVTLVVRVNENAKKTWTYNESTNSGQPDDESNDFEVYNRAQVQVNDRAKFTNKVENPLESKEEVTPGDGLPVGIGKLITYQIHWEADENQDSVITIEDPLDEGVDFVKASFGDMVLSDGTKIKEEDYTVYKSIHYDLSRTVKWTIGSKKGKVPAGASGNVTLVVRVNEKAIQKWTYDEGTNSGAPTEKEEDYEVLNRAQIQVNNEPAIFTNVVENPVPEKTEEEPGDGENVNIGKEIKYKIHWKGDPKEESYVTVTDPLDKGVDFVSASYGSVSLLAENVSASGTVQIGDTTDIPVTISYNVNSHTVTWTIGEKDGVKVPAGESGDVSLVVKVNENAVQKWTYDDSNNSGTLGEGLDNEVVNRAQVEVNDHGAFTNTVENPLGPEKSEISPGDGETVGLGDVITYEITWHNYEEEAADVIITDKLDPGVNFLSASADGVTLEDTTLSEKPEEADLTISLVGYFEKPIEFTLELTAPEGEVLSENGYVWKSDKNDTTGGTWTSEDKSITVKPGETVTVEGLPVGTVYKITVGSKVIVDGAKLGTYGSVVKIKTATEEAAPEPDTSEEDPGVTDSQVAGEENPEAENSETVTTEQSTESETLPTPEPTSALDGEPAANLSDNPEFGDELETETETEPEEESNTKPEVSSETNETPEGEETDYDLVAEIADNPAPAAQNSGDSETENSQPNDGNGFVFNKDFKIATLNGESPMFGISFPLKGIHIYYFKDAHTVVWVLEERPSGSNGEVYLSVKVNEDADKLWSYDHPELSDTEKDHLVHNKAGVKVGDNPEQETNIVHNPTEPNKTETSINGEDVTQDLVVNESDGTLEAPGVDVGDEITYEIEWMNDATDVGGAFIPSRIVVIDTLDPDVDFVNANNGGIYYKGGGTLPAENGYNEIPIPPHSVAWNLGVQEARAKGTVELTVRVKESALQKGEVVNSATVVVGNNHKQTNKVKNPVAGSLTVRKTVTGMGDRTKDFHFTVTLSDTTINGTYGDMTFVNGVAEFTLKDGESKTATGLPEGITYTVTELEANQDGYTTTPKGDSGTIKDGQLVEFINSKGSEETTESTTEPSTESTSESSTESSTEPNTEPGSEPGTNPGDDSTEPLYEIPSDDTPGANTGDPSIMGFWVLLLILSFAGMVLTTMGPVRKKHNRRD